MESRSSILLKIWVSLMSHLSVFLGYVVLFFPSLHALADWRRKSRFLSLGSFRIRSTTHQDFPNSMISTPIRWPFQTRLRVLKRTLQMLFQLCNSTSSSPANESCADWGSS